MTRWLKIGMWGAEMKYDLMDLGKQGSIGVQPVTHRNRRAHNKLPVRGHRENILREMIDRFSLALGTT